MFYSATDTITARGGGDGGYGAGIGGGDESACGNTIIEGGTVTATPGSNAAGIGCGLWGTCGDITITDTVTKVTVTKKGEGAKNIGPGKEANCGTVTIGGNVYYENGKCVNGGDTYLTQYTLVYEPKEK